MIDTDFQRRLFKKLAEVEESKAQLILAGTMDDTTYKRETSYIRALSDVRDWCEEIQNDINQGK